MEIQGTIYQGKERALGGQPLEKDFFVEKSGGWNQYEEYIGEDADILWAETAAKGDISEIAGETDLSVEDREKLISKIKKLLTEFGMWEPHIRGEGTEEFESLKKLYMLILKQIVQLPQYEEQKALFSLLDRYMLKGAERYSEKYFGTLVRFFKQFGNSRDHISLINSLFKEATGRGVEASEISRVLAEDDGAGRSSDTRAYNGAEHSSAGRRYGGMERSSVEGVIYPRTVSGKINVHDSGNMFNAKRLAEEDYLSGLNIPNNSPKDSSGYRSFFCMRDLKVTEYFLKDFLGKGDLLNNKEISVQNKEVKGFLAAATWLKAEVFLNAAEIQKELHNSVVRAVEKMVYFYMRNTPEQKFTGGHLLAEQEKEVSVYSLYSQIRLICQGERNPGKALADGLNFAYGEFRSRESNEGFFFLRSENGREDCKKGYMILKKNWKTFSEGLPVSVKEKRELDASFESPWGMYISPLNSLYYSKEKHPLILSTIVLVSIIVLWYLSIYTF